MMTQNYSEVNLIREDHQFRMEIDGATAFIDYGENRGNLVLMHTEVPKPLEGRGVAAELVKKTLEYAEANGFKVIPRCPYILAYLKKHPEWKRIVKGE